MCSALPSTEHWAEPGSPKQQLLCWAELGRGQGTSHRPCYTPAQGTLGFEAPPHTPRQKGSSETRVRLRLRGRVRIRVKVRGLTPTSRNQARSLQFMGCVWALPSHIVGMSLHRLRVLSHGAGPGLAVVRGCIGAITGMAQTGALWASDKAAPGPRAGSPFR